MFRIKTIDMKQEKINYKEIMDLGFDEVPCNNNVYFNLYGYQYCIITLDLTERIYLDWAKETQLCEMVRIDNKKTGNVKKRVPIKNLEHLKEIVFFFSDK
jgi:hypothetical protein